MKTNNYLYGIEDIPEVPEYVIMRRVEILRDNLQVILDESFQTRDGNRANAIIKAISFWSNINCKDN